MTDFNGKNMVQGDMSRVDIDWYQNKMDCLLFRFATQRPLHNEAISFRVSESTINISRDFKVPWISVSDLDHIWSYHSQFRKKSDLQTNKSPSTKFGHPSLSYPQATKQSSRSNLEAMTCCFNASSSGFPYLGSINQRHSGTPLEVGWSTRWLVGQTSEASGLYGDGNPFQRLLQLQPGRSEILGKSGIRLF